MMKFSARDRLKLLGGASAAILSACGGGESATQSAVTATVSPPPPPPPPPPVSSTPATGLLRNKYINNFAMGASLASSQIDGSDLSATIAQSQFNSITPEYELKPDIIAPTEGVFNFDPADRLVDWAISNNMQVRGHALLWHVTTPDYFLLGSPSEIKERLENYITTVVNHFKDRITVWDVVNEVVSDDIFSGAEGIGPDRRSAWYDAVGSAEYIDWAFLAARAADPNAKLFINEYDTESPLKRAWLIEILHRLRSAGVPINGVGHQFHLQIEDNPVDILAAINGVDNEFLALDNHITELDTSFYLDPGSCYETQTNCIPDIGPTAPDALLNMQAQLLQDIFDQMLQKPSVKSITFWGIRDSDSWLNTNPTERYNYPLLFDREGEPKAAFHAITDPDYVIGTTEA